MRYLLLLREGRYDGSSTAALPVTYITDEKIDKELTDFRKKFLSVFEKEQTEVPKCPHCHKDLNKPKTCTSEEQARDFFLAYMEGTCDNTGHLWDKEQELGQLGIAVNGVYNDIDMIFNIENFDKWLYNDEEESEELLFSE